MPKETGMNKTLAEIRAEWSEKERRKRDVRTPYQTATPALGALEPWTVPVVRTPNFSKKTLPGDSWEDEPPKSV